MIKSTTMIRKHLLFLIILATGTLFFVSCSVIPHPNEKIIIGKWRAVEVEKLVDSSALQAEATLKGGGEQKSKSGASRPAGDGGAGRKEAEFDRLAQLERKSTMEIFPDKTAVKNFPGHPLNATWKMKGNGKKIVARNTENKQTFVIEILEINKERIVIIEHAPVGDLRIIYERVFDAN